MRHYSKRQLVWLCMYMYCTCMKINAWMFRENKAIPFSHSSVMKWSCREQSIDYYTCAVTNFFVLSPSKAHRWFWHYIFRCAVTPLEANLIKSEKDSSWRSLIHLTWEGSLSGKSLVRFIFVFLKNLCNKLIRDWCKLFFLLRQSTTLQDVCAYDS